LCLLISFFYYQYTVKPVLKEVTFGAKKKWKKFEMFYDTAGDCLIEMTT